MPSLNNVALLGAFEYDDDITLVGSTVLSYLPHVDIGSLLLHLGYIECGGNEGVSGLVTELVIGSHKCNACTIKRVDFSKYPKLKSIAIGRESFMYVRELKLIGLNVLESAIIGMNSFTQHKNDSDDDPNRHFYLKNCLKLKSLKIGRYSFSDYSVCEIENCGLEVIEMGDLDEVSLNFDYASLELKSILIHRE